MDCTFFDLVGFAAQGQIQLNLKLLFINLLLWAACHPQLVLNSAAQTLQSVQHEVELSPTLVLQSSLLPDVVLSVDNFNPTGQTHISHVDSSLNSLINTPPSYLPEAASQSTTFTLSLAKEFYLESSEKTLFPVSSSFIDSVAYTSRWISPSLLDKTSGLPAFETPTKVFNIASTTDIVSSSDSIIESSYLTSSSLPRTPSHVYNASDLTSQASDNFSRFLSSPMSVHWTSKLLDINATVVISSSSEHISSRAEETTSSDWPSSASLINTLPPGNLSCAQGGDDCEEVNEGLDDGVRLKVIIGVVCGAAALVLLLVVLIGFLFRRRGKMSSGSKIDLSSYWDDSVTLSYINGHADIPKDNADEMISLDNDSFLNSLDSMSFTNMWTTDTAKHTNF